MKLIKPSFPRDLLSKSIEERLAYFAAGLVKHNHFLKAKREVIRAILRPKQIMMRTVIGPTGVGKTDLSKNVVREIWEMFMPDMQKDRGMIPVVRYEPPPSVSIIANMRDFFIGLLEGMNEPCIHMKIDYDKIFRLPVPELEELLYGQSNVAKTLIKAFLKSAKYRKLKALIIDEAADVLKTGGVKSMMRNLRFFKQLANQSGVVIIMIGAYELFGLKELSPQLIRRNRNIHFPRYRSTDDTEMDAFVEALLTLLRDLPMAKVYDPLPNKVEFFYENCIGCIGILNDWLLEAMDVALENGEETLTYDILESTAMSQRELKMILLEAKDRECELENTDASHQELRAELDNEIGEATEDVPELQKKKLSVKKGNKRPGQRNPFRDAVGF